MMRFTPLACAALALLSTSAYADDSSATLKAGGLVLEKTDKIALVSEDLYLSAKAIRISYRFRNLTDSDYQTLIAFPMPDLSGGPDTIIAIPDPARDNFLKFETLVDGQPVTSQVEQRAFLLSGGKADIEVTERLKTLHIPLVPTVDATETAMARLSDAQRKSLSDAGIIEVQDFNDDKGRRAVQVPMWTLRSKFWRTQVFPKGRDIVVQQNYVPVVGSLSSLSIGSPDMDPGQIDTYRTKFCTDDAFLKSVRALHKRAGNDNARTFQAFEQYVSYVITSGGNWAGPIGQFRLTVDKDDPGALVSFCGNGVKKIGATQFQLTIKDYKPDRDIDVLFARVVPVR